VTIENFKRALSSKNTKQFSKVPFETNFFRRRTNNFFDDSGSRRMDLDSGFSTMDKNTSEGKYSLNIQLGNSIAPEDLKISIKDNIVTVEAKKEQKTDDGTTSSRVYQEISRKFNLPSGVDMKEVKSILKPDGTLQIECPLPKPAIEAPRKPREIPIQFN